ncbi:MAG: hypothetical protein IPM63_10455 [Acidobacteriota bacterium]|nr:MAG: hypothetical protein IPM63_10455 [Acidobacteriota bacterium]
MKKPALTTILALILSTTAFAEFRTLQPSELKQDFALMKRALTELHPGLYRYSSQEETAKRFDEFEAKLYEPMREDRFFILLSQFLSEIKCGHTYVNPFNQKKEIFERFTDGKTYFPVYFRFVDGFFVVTENASPSELPKGTAITSINGAGIDEIVKTLSSVTTADGEGTNATRLNSIDLTRKNGGTFALFDIYFPLFYPPENGSFRIETFDPETGKESKLDVPALTRQERNSEMERRYGKTPSYDDGWKFSYLEDGTGYLRIGNFITWRLSFDWKKFLSGAFGEMRKKGTRDLIIDIREADGGDSSIPVEIQRYLSSEPLECASRNRAYIRTAKAEPELLRYIEVYDKELKAALASGLDKELFQPAENGLLEYLGDRKPCEKIAPYENRFTGDTYLLTGPANASAAFTLAKSVKDAGLATLVGRPTGGNLKGFNGGAYLFFNLPNSGFEFDIPVFAYHPMDTSKAEDSGVIPDVNAGTSVGDVSSGFDRALESASKLIREKRSASK